MQKSLTYFGCAVFACLVGCALVVYSKKTPDSTVTMPESIFAIPVAEIAPLEAKARGGDCGAAYRLGMRHAFLTLQNEEAIKWFRLAAKCPDVKSKDALLSSLMAEKDQVGAAPEIDGLITDIKRLEPGLAEQREKEILRRRAMNSQATDMRAESRNPQ